MSQIYDDYIKDHKENVFKAFQWLEENIPGVLSADEIKNAARHQCEFEHDQSKYSEEEYDAYDNYFYGNRSYAVVQEFNKAWLHHIHNNPHHWQHWVLINDDPDEGEKILDMPYQYIIEMVCDWMSFSIAKGNLNELFSWYDEHKKHMKLSDYTRNRVEIILLEIRNKLSDMDER